MKICHNFEDNCCRKNDTEKRKGTETGRIYCDFFAQHSVLDNFSRIKYQNANTKYPSGIWNFSPYPSEKLLRSKKADKHNPQKFLLSNFSENFIHRGVWILNGIACVNHSDVQIQAQNSWCWYIALTIELLINTPCSFLGLFVI